MRVGYRYNHFISNKGEWNNCFGNFAADFYFGHYRGLKLKTLCGKFLNLAHYFPCDVNYWLSRSFLANQKARNAIVRAENLLIYWLSYFSLSCFERKFLFFQL